MANRRDRARLWAGGTALVLVAGLCTLAALRTGAAEARDASFQRGVALLARGIAGDTTALGPSLAAFHLAIGRMLDDRTPYVAVHVAETVARLQAGVLPAADLSPMLQAFARGDFAAAERLSKLQTGPEAQYGVRLARALATASGAAPHDASPAENGRADQHSPLRHHLPAEPPMGPAAGAGSDDFRNWKRRGAP